MILSRAEIDRRVAGGSITISPYCPAQLNPTSYSYRLGREISELSSSDPAAARGDAVIEIDEAGMLLQPGRLYLSHTYEVIGSRECVVTLMGRPSIGRSGRRAASGPITPVPIRDFPGPPGTCANFLKPRPTHDPDRT